MTPSSFPPDFSLLFSSNQGETQLLQLLQKLSSEISQQELSLFQELFASKVSREELPEKLFQMIAFLRSSSPSLLRRQIFRFLSIQKLFRSLFSQRTAKASSGFSAKKHPQLASSLQRSFPFLRAQRHPFSLMSSRQEAQPQAKEAPAHKGAFKQLATAPLALPLNAPFSTQGSQALADPSLAVLLPYLPPSSPLFSLLKLKNKKKKKQPLANQSLLIIGMPPSSFWPVLGLIKEQGSSLHFLLSEPEHILFVQQWRQGEYENKRRMPGGDRLSFDSLLFYRDSLKISPSPSSSFDAFLFFSPSSPFLLNFLHTHKALFLPQSPLLLCYKSPSKESFLRKFEHTLSQIQLAWNVLLDSPRTSLDRLYLSHILRFMEVPLKERESSSQALHALASFFLSSLSFPIKGISLAYARD